MKPPPRRPAEVSTYDLKLNHRVKKKLRNLLLKMRSTRRSLKTPSRASVADERVLMLVMAVSPQRPQRRDARRATAERRGPRGPRPCGSCPGERPASRGWLLSPSRPPPGALHGLLRRDRCSGPRSDPGGVYRITGRREGPPHASSSRPRSQQHLALGHRPGALASQQGQPG